MNTIMKVLSAMSLGALIVGCATADAEGDDVTLGEQSSALIGDEGGYDPPEPPPPPPPAQPGPDLFTGNVKLGWQKEYVRGARGLVLAKVTPTAEVTLWNVGTVAVPASTLHVERYLGPFSYFDSGATPPIPAGEFRVVSIPFHDCAEDARTNSMWFDEARLCATWISSMRVTADPFDAIDETNESNNANDGWID